MSNHDKYKSIIEESVEDPKTATALWDAVLRSTVDCKIANNGMYAAQYYGGIARGAWIVALIYRKFGYVDLTPSERLLVALSAIFASAIAECGTDKDKVTETYGNNVSIIVDELIPPSASLINGYWQANVGKLSQFATIAFFINLIATAKSWADRLSYPAQRTRDNVRDSLLFAIEAGDVFSGNDALVDEYIDEYIQLEKYLSRIRMRAVQYQLYISFGKPEALTSDLNIVIGGNSPPPPRVDPTIVDEIPEVAYDAEPPSVLEIDPLAAILYPRLAGKRERFSSMYVPEYRRVRRSTYEDAERRNDNRLITSKADYGVHDEEEETDVQIVAEIRRRNQQERRRQIAELDQEIRRQRHILQQTEQRRRALGDDDRGGYGLDEYQRMMYFQRLDAPRLLQRAEEARRRLVEEE